jgi:hypothetical protein
MIKFNKNTDRFIIVSCTTFSEEGFKTCPLYKSYEKYKDLARWEIRYENSRGLSSVYNEYIIPENFDKIIVFVHDDVVIEDLFLFEKLQEAHKENDIVGLAGTTGTINFDITPLMWHTCTFQNQAENRRLLRGFVQHPYGDKINQTVFGLTPDQVNLIDGLFISCKISSLLNNNVFFDEDFDFHYYDLSLSIRAKKANLKLAVWPIHVLHYGLGDSYMSESFRLNQIKFKQKYSV